MIALGEVARLDREIASAEEVQRLPFVGLEHIEKGAGRFVDGYRAQPETVLAAKLRFTPDHVLYGKLRPYLNKVVLPDFQGVCTTEILPIRSDRAKLERGYLYAILLSPQFVRWASEAVAGANLPRLDPHRLLEFQIPLLPLSEQRRIAAVLQRVNHLRRMRRYALDSADSLFPATFMEMFSAVSPNFPRVEVADLVADVADPIRTGPFGSQLLHSEFTQSGVAVLGIDNVVNNRFEWGERRFITPAKYEELRRYTVFPGDVLITIMGSCGRCAVVPPDIPTAINTKHLCCISLDHTKCLPTYLHAAFLHHPLVLKDLGVSQKGAIMDGLNMQIIKALRIPLPPYRLQERFAAFAEHHGRLMAQHREGVRQAEHLFQSLLHGVFATGL